MHRHTVDIGTGGRPPRRPRMETDPHNLQRFLDAQHVTYTAAIAELRQGRKTTHWIWYVFPQLAGLGRSGEAQHYGIGGLDEARAYLAHDNLRARLRECVTAIQDLPHGNSAAGVLGEVDAMKLRSSLTLFEAAGGGVLFSAALDRWFGGVRDDATLKLLARQ
jgi:uncharacterized protein (DUF1810 family)